MFKMNTLLCEERCLREFGRDEANLSVKSESAGRSTSPLRTKDSEWTKFVRGTKFLESSEVELGKHCSYEGSGYSDIEFTSPTMGVEGTPGTSQKTTAKLRETQKRFRKAVEKLDPKNAYKYSLDTALLEIENLFRVTGFCGKPFIRHYDKNPNLPTVVNTFVRMYVDGYPLANASKLIRLAEASDPSVLQIAVERFGRRKCNLRPGQRKVRLILLEQLQNSTEQIISRIATVYVKGRKRVNVQQQGFVEQIIEKISNAVNSIPSPKAAARDLGEEAGRGMFKGFMDSIKTSLTGLWHTFRDFVMEQWNKTPTLHPDVKRLVLKWFAAGLFIWCCYNTPLRNHFWAKVIFGVVLFTILSFHPPHTVRFSHEERDKWFNYLRFSGCTRADPLRRASLSEIHRAAYGSDLDASDSFEFPNSARKFFERSEGQETIDRLSREMDEISNNQLESDLSDAEEDLVYGVDGEPEEISEPEEVEQQGGDVWSTIQQTLSKGALISLFGGDLQTVGRKAQSLNAVFAFRKNMVEFVKELIVGLRVIVDFGAEQLTGDPYTSKGKELRAIDRLVDSHRIFLERYSHMTPPTLEELARTDHTAAIKIKETYEELVSLRLKLVKADLSAAYLSTVNRLVDMYQAHYIAVVDAMRRAKTRVEPACVYLFGPPGHGKTMAMNYIIAAVYKQLYPGKEWLASNRYERKQEQDFWDGYHGQFATTIDDAFQMKDVNLRAQMSMEIINMVNTNEFPLHMAAIEQKDTTPFTSELVMLTTNAKADPRDLGIVQKEAVYRRLHFRFRVRARVEHKVNGVVVGKFSQVDRTGSFLNDWRFFLQDPEQKEIEMSFKEVVQAIVEKIKENRQAAAMSDSLLNEIVWEEIPDPPCPVVPEEVHDNQQACDEPESEEETPLVRTKPRWRVKVQQQGNTFRRVREGLVSDMGALSDLLKINRLVPDLRPSWTHIKFVDMCISGNWDAYDTLASELGEWKAQDGVYAGMTCDAWRTLYFLMKFTHWSQRHTLYTIFRRAPFDPSMIQDKRGFLNPIIRNMGPAVYDILRESGLVKGSLFTMGEYVKALKGQRVEVYGDTYNKIEIFEAMYTNCSNTQRANFAKWETRLQMFRYKIPDHEYAQNVVSVVYENIEHILLGGGVAIILIAITGLLIKGLKSAYTIITGVNAEQESEPGVEKPKRNLNTQRAALRKFAAREFTITGKRVVPKKRTGSSGKGHKQKRGGRRQDATQQGVDELEIELQSDSNATELAAKAIHNVRRFIATFDTTSKSGYCTFIKGRIFATAGHVLEAPEGEKLRHVTMMAGWQDSETGFSVHMADSLKIKFLKDRDLALVFLPNGREFKDLSKNLRDEPLPVMSRTPARLVISEQDIPLLWAGDYVEPAEIRSGGVERDGVYWARGCNGAKGHCGLPYFQFNKGASKKLLGIHVAGKGDDSVFSPLYQTDILDFTQTLPERIMSLGEEVMPEGFEIAYDGPSTQFVSGTAPYMKLARPLHMPTKNRIKATVLQNEMEGVIDGRKIKFKPPYPVLEKPTHISPFINDKGERVSPLHKAFDKFADKATFPMPRGILNEKYFKGLKYPGWEKTHIREFTLEEAVHGLPEEEDFGGLPTDSSGGPYYAQKGLLAKDLFCHEPKFIHPSLKEKVEREIEMVGRGEIPPYLVSATLKSERRSIKRVDEGDTRIFANGEKSHLIRCRMFLGAIYLRLIRNRGESEFGIGINPHGYSWQVLYRRLCRFDHAVCDDVKNWDLRMPLYVRDIFMWWIENEFKIHKGTNWYNQIYGCVAPIFQSIWLCGGNSFIAEWMPSGTWLTALLNTFWNSVANRYMFYQLVPEGTEFDDHVSAVYHGDDNLMTLSKSVLKFFDGIRRAEAARVLFGWVVTAWDKSDKLVPYCRLSEMTFLKRKFVPGQNGYVLCPLEMKSIMMMVYWIEESNEVDFTYQTILNCHVACTEWFYHGRAIFEQQKEILNSRLALIDRNRLFLGDWPSMHSAWLNSYYEEG